MQSFGYNNNNKSTSLNPAERELFLNQIAMVEQQRDQARRETQVLGIENQVLQSAIKKEERPASVNMDVIR